MSKPRYNRASLLGSVTYKWFSFISFVKVLWNMAFSKALNIKNTFWEEEQRKRCQQKGPHQKEDISIMCNKEAVSSALHEVEKS